MKSIEIISGCIMKPMSHVIIYVLCVLLLYSQALQAETSNPCTADINGCVVVSYGPLELKPAQTKAFDVYCPQAAPYYRQWSYDSDSNDVGVLSWGWSMFVDPYHDHLTATNRSLAKKHNTTIYLACSVDPKEGVCVNDPGCPDVPGSRQDECGDPASGMCYSFWTEKCSSGMTYTCNTTLLRVCCSNIAQ
jgi:hypothetical protein